MTEQERKTRLEEVEKLDVQIDALYSRRTLIVNELDSNHVIDVADPDGTAVAHLLESLHETWMCSVDLPGTKSNDTELPE
jgi:regulator of extracellular matrix RemA (YlzA/DUF370 family)